MSGRCLFPALTFVASAIVVLSWIDVVGGVLAGVSAIAAAGPQGMPGSPLVGISIVLLPLLAAIFVRAGAEMINLTLYRVTLLEDIRST